MLPASWACGFPAHLGVPGWGSRSSVFSLQKYDNYVPKGGLDSTTLVTLEVYGGAV